MMPVWVCSFLSPVLALVISEILVSFQGNLYLSMNRPEAAVIAFRGAQELRPDLRSYQGLVFGIYDHMGHFMFMTLVSFGIDLIFRFGPFLFGSLKNQRGFTCCSRSNEGHASICQGSKISWGCACKQFWWKREGKPVIDHTRASFKKSQFSDCCSLSDEASFGFSKTTSFCQYEL